jgi:RNA polymerase sigma-70 factor, ECF subfamily
MRGAVIETRNPEALAEIYREFHPRVLAICRRLLGRAEEAEEAANDIFVRLPDALDTYNPTQSFARWLSAVTGNHCMDLLRRRRSEARVLAPAGVETPEPVARTRSPLHELLRREEADRVREALFSLPERYFVPLVMRYYSELSYDQIAEALGTRRVNVAVLILRAKRELERILAGGKVRARRLARAHFEAAPAL